MRDAPLVREENWVQQSWRGSKRLTSGCCNPRSPRCKPGGYFCVCERLFFRGKEAKPQSQKCDDNEAFAALPSDPPV